MIRTETRTLYRDPRFYSAFPSVVARRDGTLLLAFRRCPDRRFGSPTWVNSHPHTDPNSQIVAMTSADGGATWSAPRVIWSHAFGGLQDPCLLELASGRLLCASYAWMQTSGGVDDGNPHLFRCGDYRFLGGCMVVSDDGGATWWEELLPAVPGEISHDPFGQPVPIYNRGALCQRADGTVCWAVASRAGSTEGPSGAWSAVHLMTAGPDGRGWQWRGIVARHEQVAFNETSLFETPGGDLVAFLRTHQMEGEGAIARLRRGEDRFGPWEPLGFKAEPLQATRLPDGRCFLVYGWRHAPDFGVRARILDPECRHPAAADEIVLSRDGGNYDIGYPWATVLPDGRVFVAAYHHTGTGSRTIEGHWVEV